MENHQQTHTHELRELSDKAVAGAAEKAEAELSALKAAVYKAQNAAAEALKTFEQTPSAESLANREVRAQQAKNARQALDAKTIEYEPLFAEARRRKQLQRLTELKKQLRWREDVDAAADQLVETYKNFRDGIQLQVETIAKLIEVYNARFDELNGLERTVGTGEHQTRVDFHHLMQAIHERIEREFGRADSADPGFGRFTLNQRGATLHDCIASVQYPIHISHRVNG